MTDSTSGGYRIPTRVCLRVTTERQRSTRFGEGSSRSEKDHGESASSALEKAPVSEVRRIAIRLKLAAANSSVDPPLP
jgi:hypothetical protein